MKYKYLIIAFTTTIVILTNLAYPTNATHAGDITNEPQSSPKVAPIYKVRTALTVNPPSLDKLASNPQEFTVKNTHITNYSIENLKSTRNSNQHYGFLFFENNTSTYNLILFLYLQTEYCKDL